MSNNIPPLNMSCVIAFIEKSTNKKHDTLDYLKKNDPSLSHIDWIAPADWEKVIDFSNSSDSIDKICRNFCLQFINSTPYLLKLTCYGRDSLISNLSADELQVFRIGKLLEKIPEADVVSWWDNLKIASRSELDDALLAQGRLAESWTIEEEKQKLSLFCSLEPEWVALNSDRYGYDVLSYRKGEGGTIQSIQVEVKSYQSQTYPHFYITCNEWEKSKLAESAYYYYIWCIETREYQILSINDIVSHIPNNNGVGKWQTVLIEPLIT
jgi:hypothetical protein